MSKLPLVEGILKYTKKNNIPFSMPGHKIGRGFVENCEGKELYDNIIKCDVTEVDGTDNLHHPDSIIKEAEDMLCNFYKSKKSYFLVNGSTSGIMIMIFSCFNENDKIIVDRSCHKSVFNAIILRKLKAVYVDCEINKYGFPLGININSLNKEVNANKDAKGIFVTYPNYYGVCSDLKKISQLAIENNMRLLVDSAHGAHFGISKKLPESAVKYCDAVVMSSHKTLPAFTQTAYLHLNNMELCDKFDFYFDCFISTSPSYMLMCSMDYARFYLETKGKDDFEKLMIRADFYKKKINLLSLFHIIEKDDIENYISTNKYVLDETRYVLNCDFVPDINIFLNYLSENRIQYEMCDNRNIIFILSPFNADSDFETLYNVLKNYDDKFKNEKIENNDRNDILDYIYEDSKNQRNMLPLYEVQEAKKTSIYYKKTIGRICADFITPYPPGIPVILPGEILDYKKVEIIDSILKNKNNILGINNGFIKVLDL